MAGSIRSHVLIPTKKRGHFAGHEQPWAPGRPPSRITLAGKPTHNQNHIDRVRCTGSIAHVSTPSTPPSCPSTASQGPTHKGQSSRCSRRPRPPNRHLRPLFRDESDNGATHALNRNGTHCADAQLLAAPRGERGSRFEQGDDCGRVYEHVEAVQDPANIVSSWIAGPAGKSGCAAEESFG